MTHDDQTHEMTEAPAMRRRLLVCALLRRMRAAGALDALLRAIGGLVEPLIAAPQVPAVALQGVRAQERMSGLAAGGAGGGGPGQGNGESRDLESCIR